MSIRLWLAAIEEVIPDAPGQKAGLQAGDVILKVGSHSVASPEDVLDASFFLTAEDETVIRVTRDGSQRDFNVTPADNPDARPRVSTTGVPEVPLKIDR